MELECWRYSGGVEATLGLLMLRGVETWELLCFVCEDEHRREKVRGETRIPAGRYQIELRDMGGMHSRYAARFGPWHYGMLWLRHVPGFSFAYIHIGNDDDDTEGCLLVGEGRDETARSVRQSTNAYKRIYPRIVTAIGAEGAWITIRDLDRAVLPVPLSVDGTL